MDTYDKQFIGGKWCEGTGDAILENRNPYTGEVLYSYRSASKADVDAAYAAAASASISWAQTAPAERMALLDKLADAIESHANEMTAILIEEGGSCAPKVGFECNVTPTIIRQAEAFPYMMKGTIVPSDMPGRDNYVFRRPKGVIGVITPWNVPFVLAMRSVAPAIACGNAVVLKPASDTPASAMFIAKCFEEAGFPAGIFNVVAGSGSEIGDYFVEHPVPSLISFTGSTAVGRRIGSLAGSQIKDVSLELGGNNVMLVCADADIDQAVKAAVFGKFFHQGQICMAINRILVEAPIYDKFAEALVAATKQLKVGDPADPEVFIGPIINDDQLAKVEGFVKANIDAGATVALEGYTEGHCVHPWIFTDCTNEMPAAASEAFGPLVSLIKIADPWEGVALANSTEYGLSGSVFSSDIYKGMLLARHFESGMVHVNDQTINDEPQCMFGGEKCSGIGRFNGQWVVSKFTTEQWVSVQGGSRF